MKKQRKSNVQPVLATQGYTRVPSTGDQEKRASTVKTAITPCVSLYRQQGKTVIHIEARITDTGAVAVSGHDIGAAPQDWWGDEDYEYGVTIPADHKDSLLLALLEQLYTGNPHTVEDLKQWLAQKGIPHTFQTWV